MLAELLKPKGILALREPLSDTGKLATIQRLAGQSGLARRDSRIIDVPYLGNSLEIVYCRE